MADDAPVIYSAPTGRKLPSGPDGNVVFTLYGLPPATEELLAVLRRHLDEIDVAHLEHIHKRRWRNTVTGEELERIKSYVDPPTPKASGATSYCVVDDGVLYFGPRGALEARAETVEIGTMRSWRA